MRALVTGGAGYIGSVIVEALVERGHTAVVYDNLSEGHREAVVGGAEFVAGELADVEKLKDTLSRHKIDLAIHMAAVCLVGESVSDPAKYYSHNVSGTLSLLEAMLAVGVKFFVFSSTAAVYGEPQNIPISEEEETRPTNPYGETKLACERALPWYEAAYGLRYISLRYFNAAGASRRCGEDHRVETHLIPRLLEVALGQRDAIEIYGLDYPTRDGSCIRDYIHVLDLAEAHIKASERLLSGESSGVYNLGNGSGYSVLEVLEAARRVTGREIPARYGPRRPGDPAVLVASCEKARRALGWEPKLPGLEEIVESAWRWKLEHRLGYGRA